MIIITHKYLNNAKHFMKYINLKFEQIVENGNHKLLQLLLQYLRTIIIFLGFNYILPCF